MSTKVFAMLTSSEPVDCFGDYNSKNPLCAKHCALRLSCAIEQDHNIRTEILEDLVANEDGLGKIQ